jgi:hypothetical protein
MEIIVTKEKSILDINIPMNGKVPVSFTYNDLCEILDYLYDTSFTFDKQSHPAPLEYFIYEKTNYKEVNGTPKRWYELYLILKEYELKKELWKII